MVSTLVAELGSAVSAVRLEAYRLPGSSDFDMVVNYVWNVELSKALYPAMQALEVSLRNSIHIAASNFYQTGFWFDQADVVFEGQSKRIEEARAKLAKLGKPQTADDIVAALTFGFWVSLFNKPFELPLPPASPNQLAWHDAQSRPSTLFLATFPYAPRGSRHGKRCLSGATRFWRCVTGSCTTNRFGSMHGSLAVTLRSLR